MLKVQRWGNSLAVRIPKAAAEQARMGEGTVVEVQFVNGSLVLTPAEPDEMTLVSLLKGVTDENIHGEVDFVAPVGKEAW